jgi:hypothetical protein
VEQGKEEAEIKKMTKEENFDWDSAREELNKCLR